MNILLGKTQLCVIILVSVSFGSNISGSVDFSLRVRKQRDRQDIYTVCCIDSSSKSFLALRTAVGEVHQSMLSYVTDICALHRLMQHKLCLAFPRIFRRIFHFGLHIFEDENQSIDIQIPCSKANYLDLKGCRPRFLPAKYFVDVFI